VVNPLLSSLQVQVADTTHPVDGVGQMQPHPGAVVPGDGHDAGKGLQEYAGVDPAGPPVKL